jgi:hypothetical protein
LRVAWLVRFGLLAVVNVSSLGRRWFELDLPPLPAPGDRVYLPARYRLTSSTMGPIEIAAHTQAVVATPLAVSPKR